MRKLANCLLFVKNAITIIKGGKTPLWRELWRISLAGIEVASVSDALTKIADIQVRAIRQVIDACGLSVQTAGTLGMTYLIATGHKTNNPNKDVAALRVLSETRTPHIRVDSLAILLIERRISPQKYLLLHSQLSKEDQESYQHILQQYKTGLPKEVGRGPLPQLARRVLNGESPESVLWDFVCSIWPDLKENKSMSA